MTDGDLSHGAPKIRGVTHIRILGAEPGEDRSSPNETQTELVPRRFAKRSSGPQPSRQQTAGPLHGSQRLAGSTRGRDFIWTPRSGPVLRLGDEPGLAPPRPSQDSALPRGRLGETTPVSPAFPTQSWRDGAPHRLKRAVWNEKNNTHHHGKRHPTNLGGGGKLAVTEGRHSGARDWSPVFFFFLVLARKFWFDCRDLVCLPDLSCDEFPSQLTYHQHTNRSRDKLDA